MNKDLDVTILSPIMSAGQIGVYKMAKNLALLTWRAVDPFYLALMPELNRRVQLNDLKGVRSLLKRSASGLAIFAFALCAATYLGVLFFGEALLGPAFAEIPRIIVWMLAGVILSAPLVWGHPLSVALNRGDIPLVGSLLGLGIGLASFFMLTPILGITGVAISWSLSFAPHFLYTSATSYRLFRKRWPRH
jgi:O-antigen/teichoic acid export membrane protein